MLPKIAALGVVGLGVLIIGLWNGVTINGKTAIKSALLLAVLCLTEIECPPITITSEFFADLIILTVGAVGTSVFLFGRW